MSTASRIPVPVSSPITQPGNEKPCAVEATRGESAQSVGVSTPSFVMRLKDCEAVNRAEANRPPRRPGGRSALGLRHGGARYC